MKQWWDMKIDHYDTVLFFKVGKFYELYHMDAVIGVKELGLSFMKGEFAHSGFPEIAYGRFSECLVQKGYKVARVEQTETPQMMEERCKNMNRPTKFDKVVNREICQVTTKGTRTLTYQEEPMGPENNFLLAICEKHFEDSENELEYGICFVDTTIGKFTLSQFKDDRHRSRLLTLVALYPPVEIIYERSSVSKATLQLLINNLSSVPKEALNSGSEFWDSTKVLKYLSEKKYFKEGDAEEIPDVLKNMLDEDDRLQQTPLKQYELAFKSLGACIWYLKECFIDDSLVTMKLFEEYHPADGFTKEPTKTRNFSNQHMVLDGTTLNNLEIVPNNASENDGSLYTTMDFCSTKFGKRLFRYWLCSPLCNPKSIADRLDAIEDLMKIPDVVDHVTTRLKKIPDLERMLSKIHSQGISRSKSHPESRAIFYEADIYNRRKLQDFLLTLDGFKESIDVIAEFEGHADHFKSRLLKKCVKTADNDGSFPNLSDALDYFNHAFDHKEAKKEGNIIPCKGVDEDYDSACAELRKVEGDLDDYLNELKRKFNCKVSYVGSGRTRFQVEIPDNKKVPEDFEFQGARKGFRRFYTDEARGYLARYIAAEESRELALRDVSRRIYAHFDKDYELWKSAIHCLATIDVLLSLHQYNRSSDVSMCRPEFVLPDEDTEPFLEIVEGKHPSFLKYFTDDSYIPNSVYIGSKMKEAKENINSGGRVVLVTGPNMGGKSTLMRQAGALVIMAQVGSFIPAVSMKLTPVDRIFTRVGANDQISKGESTFFVEASETASIIHHATRDSFVLVDELGRGTSTHDGTAIAYSVLDNLANSICCRTLFSTHYHSLVEDFHSHPTVGLGHMACMVEKDNDCPALERITFLYKFIDGACPKSYGFNVALLAGVANDIVQKGFTKAQEMECVPRISKLLKKFLSIKEASDITSEIQRRVAAI
ncbi:DNA mismatch repair protein Msh6-like [Uloborus diversus]|uniref:DNA mismatch repair protein Msh6-like n=1 Tax=Uloborus diversus TaxID=327109 RepID=UPI002409361D|nr:DNA mismatch repair protein Msh6-like [Uloborus diversus]